MSMKHSFFLDFAILTVTSFALMACVHDGDDTIEKN